MGYIMLGIIGLSAGLLVAGGMFAFITMIGVVERMAARSKTAVNVRVYEDFVVAGGTIGNLLSIYQWSIPTGYFALATFGLFAGVYVGCLSFALAEILNVFPVFIKRVNLRYGLPYIILIFAIGKGLGALFQYISGKL